MFVIEKEFEIPAAPGHRNLLAHIPQALKLRLSGSLPLRRPLGREDAGRSGCGKTESALLAGRYEN